MAGRRPTTRDRGYVMFLTALLLLPLLAIAAIGVDFGLWYLQAARNQRVADAAALAGAVWMPDQDLAEAAALDAVARNGLTPGVDSTVNIDFPGNNSVRVQVSSKSELSFSDLFLDEFAITRSAVGEYVPPVAIGSPLNRLGEEGLWLAISGDCSVRENGDLLAARTLAGYPGGSYPPAMCGGGFPNPDYTGVHTFAVIIDQNPGQAVTVQVYDGTYAPSSGKSTDFELRPPSRFDTTFTLYDAPGPPFDITAHAVLASRTYPDRDAASDAQWTTIGTIPNPEPGLYYLTVSTNGTGGLDSFGSNGYGLREFAGVTPTNCSSRPTDFDYSPSCPQVAAVEHMSTFASLSNGSKEFFLAEIDGKHAGKDLEISLFDVGEGAERIEIIDPDGNPVPFTWTTDCTVTPPASPPGCSGTHEAWTDPSDGSSHPYTLDVSGSGVQVYADTFSTSLWNDRTVVFTIDIPNDYATAYAGRWWKVKYYFGSDITDRTTWSVRVIGDPVRLAG